VGTGVVLAFGAAVALASDARATGDGTDEVAALFGRASHAIRAASISRQRDARPAITTASLDQHVSGV